MGSARKQQEESTAIDTNPVTHTPQEQATIEEYQSQTDDALKEKFEQYLDNPRRAFSRHTISAVSSRQAEDAGQILGGDFTGYSNAINSNGIVHILNRHGPNGEEDHSLADLNDASRIGYILENYDTVEAATYESGTPDLSAEFRTKDNRPAPMLKYSKKVNGTYYVVEAVPESKHKKFWVVSAYMEKATGGTQAPNANGPGNTPDASLASGPAAFNNSIPTSPNAVKGKADGTIGADRSLVERFRQLQLNFAKAHSWKTDWDVLEAVFFRYGFEAPYGETLYVQGGEDAGELYLSQKQLKELSAMYNEGIYQLFREVLREEAPATLEDFCKIRYRDMAAAEEGFCGCGTV